MLYWVHVILRSSIGCYWGRVWGAMPPSSPYFSLVSGTAVSWLGAPHIQQYISNSRGCGEIQEPIPKFSSVHLLSCVQLFATPWTAACQVSPSISNSWSLPKLMSIESVMPSNHLILCHPLLLPPSIFPNIRVFSNESALRIRWPKYRNFSFNISPSNEHTGLISFRMDRLDLLAVQGTLKSLLSSIQQNTTVQKHQFFSAQLSL